MVPRLRMLGEMPKGSTLRLLGQAPKMTGAGCRRGQELARSGDYDLSGLQPARPGNPDLMRCSVFAAMARVALRKPAGAFSGSRAGEGY